MKAMRTLMVLALFMESAMSFAYGEFNYDDYYCKFYPGVTQNGVKTPDKWKIVQRNVKNGERGGFFMDKRTCQASLQTAKDEQSPDVCVPLDNYSNQLYALENGKTVGGPLMTCRRSAKARAQENAPVEAQGKALQDSNREN